eukprot:CAMPEP_0204176620 /NCGR_PEP_ID=MMETSP0361-20130328/47766_1 /ASSEMBLY_ACC=CAM_ASM_000343 /TAXON_ID=268821 /ORGANISM="Scrippsiella Hangoei, Strain SHTV-5" /LENGTH=111 /DNA_ID=CAMNT_0051135443 /DNA_START=856 /DNA_END=1191 /DNA_ORIENTATION=-
MPNYRTLRKALDEWVSRTDVREAWQDLVVQGDLEAMFSLLQNGLRASMPDASMRKHQPSGWSASVEVRESRARLWSVKRQMADWRQAAHLVGERPLAEYADLFVRHRHLDN